MMDDIEFNDALERLKKRADEARKIFSWVPSPDEIGRPIKIVMPDGWCINSADKSS